MQTVRAFELREGLDAETFGGSATLPDGTSLDLAAALAEGDGVIVTGDENTIVALDSHTALKRAAVPEDQRGYDGMLKADLVAEVDRRNAADDDRPAIELPDNATKEQIISALVADDAEGNR